MFLAVPILMIVAFYMMRLMFTVTLNALPILAGLAAFFVVRGADGSIVQALLAGGGVALAVTTLGRVAIERSSTPLARGLILIAFAGPVAVIAFPIVWGLSAPVVGSALGCVAAAGSALVAGSIAWRKFAEPGGRPLRD